MSLAVVYSRAQVGVHAPEVIVEVHIANGLPGLSIVGLPEAAVREAKDRVRGALLHSGFEFPARRITINLAPADLPKEGGRFDLPIALGILAASGQLALGGHDPLRQYEFVGELALTGALRPVKGALIAALGARQSDRRLVLPRDNGAEAALVSDLSLHPADHLLGVTAHLNGQQALEYEPDTNIPAAASAAIPDLVEVRGQHQAKRVLEIAAAGGHSLLMFGPPGSGKTMLASRLPGILPAMTEAEALEAAAVQSVSEKGFHIAQWRRRHFRSPHHTASGVALVGGGSHPRPGEISLAHHGVLFLDELPEFDRKVLEVLREPLESGHITISRAARQAEFPARFQLIAAMNPCPCGYHGDPGGRCRCTQDQVQRYRNRLSGPLMDRIDLHVEVPALPGEDFMQPLNSGEEQRETSATVQARVIRARERQLARSDKPNAHLSAAEMENSCFLDEESRKLMETTLSQLGLSARAFHRICRVARTIADLEGAKQIRRPHLAEAIQYRLLDRAPRRAEGGIPA